MSYCFSGYNLPHISYRHTVLREWCVCRWYVHIAIWEVNTTNIQPIFWRMSWTSVWCIRFTSQPFALTIWYNKYCVVGVCRNPQLSNCNVFSCNSIGVLLGLLVESDCLLFIIGLSLPASTSQSHPTFCKTESVGCLSPHV